MAEKTFAIHGNILYSDEKMRLVSRPDSFLVCDDGLVAGVFDTLPEKYVGTELRECGDSLVIPGLVDLHLHAPQYTFCGLGMDLELLEWLNTHTFPEEAKYADLGYAKAAYGHFVDALTRGATTRAAVFATLHTPATLLLMDLLEESGLQTRVGRVNMDRNSLPELQEQNAATALADAEAWLAACEGHYQNTKPILTPRFAPSCSDELMAGLGRLQRCTGLPVQSHLSENPAEVAWVKELCPGVETYADAYIRQGLFGGAGCDTIMAHCVYSLGREMEQLAEHGVWVAHCPISNSCLSSGVAPVRGFLQSGVKTGLGTDVAGGHALSIFAVMAEAVKDSKLRWRLEDSSLAPLTLPEVFYLATRGGGSFFGRVGAFEEGYEFDALVLDDAALLGPRGYSIPERLERMVYLGGDGNVAEKYVAGRRIL